MAFKEIKQDRAKETRDRIILGAAKTFAESGYAGASIANILEESGTTKGALYFHFTTKREVAEAVIFADLQRFREIAETYETGTGINGLIQVIYVNALRRVSDPLARATARLYLEGELLQHRQGDVFRLWSRLIESTLTEHSSRRMLRDNVDPHQLAELITATFLGAHQSSDVWGLSERALTFVEAWWRMILPGMVKPEMLELVEVKPSAAVLSMEMSTDVPDLAAAVKQERTNPVCRPSAPMLGRPGLPSSFAAS